MERAKESSKLHRPESRPLDLDDIDQSVGYVVIIGILLLAFALGARGLDFDPIWTDELSSVTHFGAFDPAFTPAQVVVSLQKYSPDQSILYYILGAQWSRIAGYSQLALRLPSALFGLLMIASLYRFVADILSRRTAVIAAVLITTNAFVVLFYHDMRLYTLLMWLAIAHTWLYWRITHSRRVSWRTWLLFASSTCTLLYLWNLSAILFLGLGYHHLVFVKKSRRWLGPMAGWCLGAFTFLPYLPILVDAIRFQETTTLNPLQTGEVIELLARLLVNGFTLLWMPLIAVFVVAIWKNRNSTVLRLLSVALVMIAAILAVNSRFNVITFTRLRYFLILWPFVVTLFAFGLTSIPRWRMATLVFGLLWILLGYQFDRSGEVVEFAGLMTRVRSYPPMHEYVNHLAGKVNPLDYLLGFAEDDRVSQVLPNSSNSMSDYYLQTQLGIDGVFLHASLKRYRLEPDVWDILSAHPYVLLAHDPSAVPRNYAKTLEIISQIFIPCAILVDNPDLHIQRYAQPVMGCGHEARSITFENGIRVLDFSAQYNEQGERIAVLVWWDVPDESMFHEFNISLQIITPEWENVRQTDRHLYDQIVPWNVIELSTADLPAGAYRLMLVLYRRDTGERMNGLDATSGAEDKMSTLLEFEIRDK